MDNITSIKNIASGKYTVKSYEPIDTRYGRKYLVTVTIGSDEVVFWSNAVLASYIKEFRPTRSFEITKARDTISIKGYNEKVTLI